MGSHFSAKRHQKSSVFWRFFAICFGFDVRILVHSFLAQNIVKNPNRKTYSKLILYSFIAGMIIFTNANMAHLVNLHLLSLDQQTSRQNLSWNHLRLFQGRIMAITSITNHLFNPFSHSFTQFRNRFQVHTLSLRV